MRQWLSAMFKASIISVCIIYELKNPLMKYILTKSFKLKLNSLIGSYDPLTESAYALCFLKLAYLEHLSLSVGN